MRSRARVGPSFVVMRLACSTSSVLDYFVLLVLLMLRLVLLFMVMVLVCCGGR